jgi:hypothetical protein
MGMQLLMQDERLPVVFQDPAILCDEKLDVVLRDKVPLKNLDLQFFG